MNSHGEIYETKYGLTTSQRLYGTVTGEQRGTRSLLSKDRRNQCSTGTGFIQSVPQHGTKPDTQMVRRFGRGPASENVEIEGTEPYIVGGHTASGYWVDNGRRTTVKGLFAAGDVAGGCPQKYVTGALAEGEIAAESMTKYLKNLNADSEKSNAIKEIETKIDNASILKKKEYEAHLTAEGKDSEDTFFITAEQLEEAMQKVMDQYAGGSLPIISTMKRDW